MTMKKINDINDMAFGFEPTQTSIQTGHYETARISELLEAAPQAVETMRWACGFFGCKPLEFHECLTSAELFEAGMVGRLTSFCLGSILRSEKMLRIYGAQFTTVLHFAGKIGLLTTEEDAAFAIPHPESAGLYEERFAPYVHDVRKCIATNMSAPLYREIWERNNLHVDAL